MFSLRLQKYSLLISLFLLLSILAASLFLPALIPALGTVCLLFAIVTGVAFIIEKHKGEESARRKIAKGISIFVISFILTILLGGLAGSFAAQYAGLQGWGSFAMLASAILASFTMGYTVNRAAGKIIKA